MRHPPGTLRSAIVALAMLAAACGSNPPASVLQTLAAGFDFPIDCGPIADVGNCRLAVAVAATAKSNPPPIGRVNIRRPVPGDTCATAFHACGPSAVIVTIESGDTLQDVPLLPLAGDGWVRLDLVR